MVTDHRGEEEDSVAVADSAHATSGEEAPGEWATKANNRECRKRREVQWKREDFGDEDAVAADSVEASGVAAAADSVAVSEEASEAEVVAADSEVAVVVVDVAEVAHAAVAVELPTSQMPAPAKAQHKAGDEPSLLQTSSNQSDLKSKE